MADFPISTSKTIHAINVQSNKAPAKNKEVAGSLVKSSHFCQTVIDMAVTKMKSVSKCFFLKKLNNGTMTQDHSNTTTVLNT